MNMTEGSNRYIFNFEEIQQENRRVSELLVAVVFLGALLNFTSSILFEVLFNGRHGLVMYLVVTFALIILSAHLTIHFIIGSTHRMYSRFVLPIVCLNDIRPDSTWIPLPSNERVAKATLPLPNMTFLERVHKLFEAFRIERRALITTWFNEQGGQPLLWRLSNIMPEALIALVFDYYRQRAMYTWAGANVHTPTKIGVIGTKNQAWGKLLPYQEGIRVNQHHKRVKLKAENRFLDLPTPLLHPDWDFQLPKDGKLIVGRNSLAIKTKEWTISVRIHDVVARSNFTQDYFETICFKYPSTSLCVNEILIEIVAEYRKSLVYSKSDKYYYYLWAKDLLLGIERYLQWPSQYQTLDTV